MFLDMRSAWNHDRGRRSQGGGRSGDLTAARARQPSEGDRGGAQPNAGIVPLRERRRRPHHGGANRTMEGNLADKHDSGSPWAVAYQLAMKIADEEADSKEREASPRGYFLRLYAETMEAVVKAWAPGR